MNFWTKSVINIYSTFLYWKGMWVFMTIRKRLFISNILMLVVPIIVSIIAITTIVNVFMNILGIEEEKGYGSFYNATLEVEMKKDKWNNYASIEEIKKDLSEIKANHSDLGIALYENGVSLYKTEGIVENSFINSILKEKGKHSYSIDNTNIYKTDMNGKTILITGNPGEKIERDYIEYTKYIINIIIIIIFVVIVIIFVTNRLLTKMIIKNIINPLETLVYGVHQIRDGNLDYRIYYRGKDEFTMVCEDFNEMAKRLMDMVNERKKDDENRRELIAGISHDLRTPLTSIKTYVEGLELGIAKTEEMQKHYLNTIKIKTADLEHIIKQLFLFSKLDIGEFPMNIENVDIGEYISSFVDEVTPYYKDRDLNIRLLENVNRVIVAIDKVQIKNVLTNMLENSIKYGDKKGKEASIIVKRNNTKVRIELNDNGPGVREGEISKLFNVFYRGDRSRRSTSKGSGLGLAISSKTIEQLGGTIKAKNLTEGGLSIIIELPIIGE